MSNKQVIIIHGIMGSEITYGSYILFPPHKSMLWKPKSLINACKYLSDLENEDIEVSKYYEKYYKNLVNHITSLDINSKVTVFCYDWRQNNIKHIDELAQHIDKNADEVIIIAHSMGGIVSKLFLNSEKYKCLSSKVSKLITIGTPWKGSANAYKRLKFGANISINGIREIIKPIIGKCESVYQLLPNAQYIEEHKVRDGRRYLNNKKWEDVYNENYLPIIQKNGINVKETLEEFYKQMSKDLPSHIEHHEIIGYNNGTLTGIYDEGNSAEGIFGNGDGTVSLISAISHDKNNYFIKCEHKALTSNEIVFNIIDMILNDDESYDNIKQNLNLPTKEEVLEDDFKIEVYKIACPVSVSMIDKNGNTIYGDLEDLESDNLLELFIYGDKNVDYIDGDVYFILNENKEIDKFKIVAYEEGAVSISIKKYTNSGLLSKTKFRTFNMNNFKEANIVIENDNYRCDVKTFGEKIDELKIIDSITINEEFIATELPQTKYKLTGKKVSCVDNKYIATGDVYLHIESINKGSYNIEGTFYSINGSNYTLIEKDRIILNLSKGMNNIKIYSSDIYGNIEEIQEETIYYIENDKKRIPKIVLNTTPDSYTLSTEFKKSNILNPTCKFIIENYEGYEGGYIENEGIIRTIYLEIEDELGKMTCEPFKVNEKLLNLILRSNSSVDDVKTFLLSVGISTDNMNRYKYISERKIRSYKHIEKTRITDADKLIFSNEDIEVEIDKKRNLEVMFSNLIEYINVDENNISKFEFSVFKNRSNKYTDEDISILLAKELDNGEYSEIKEIEYKIENEKYCFTIVTNEIKSLMNVYEIENNIFVLIKIKDDKETILRVCDIELK